MPRGRKPKRQSFAFPGPEQPVINDDNSDAALDRLIEEGPQPEPAKEGARKIKEDGEKKKLILDAAKAIPEIFKPEDVVFAFDVYVGIVCFLFSIAYKCDFNTLWEELKLDDMTKTHLSKPLAKVFSKYAPAEWAGMTAEIELISFVGIWTVTSMPRAKSVADKEKAKKQTEQRRDRNTVTAMPQDRDRAAIPV